MSGQISGFLSSAKLVIRMGNLTVGYATNLSFSDRMAVAPVGGIGSYSADALEPLQYSSGGSMTITVYTKDCITALKGFEVPALLPSRATNASGNSMLTKNAFSPIHLMVSRTFDIEVFERTGQTAESSEVATYMLQDCRLTSYSMTFTPGSLIQENVGFICMSVVDKTAEAGKIEYSVKQ